MHFNSSQSRSAWTEQEDDLLRNAVGIYGERSWANVAQMVPGRSSKSCSDRWRNFLSPDIEHPRKSPFTEWEIAVVVLAQTRYGNNWKAISLLLPGRTNRAVKNLFVGNLKWGARLPEIRNRFLEWGMSLESLLEIKPDRAGGPIKPRPGQALPEGMNTMSQDGSHLSGSPASTSSAGSAWQSDMTDHPNGSPGSANTSERRRRADGEMAAATAGQQSSPVTKRRRGAQNGGGSPVLGGLQHHLQSPSLTPHPGALGPSFASGTGGTGSPQLGITLPGTMGPPANRAPSYLPTEHHPSSLTMPRQQAGLNSSNGSNDGTSVALAALHPGSEATPTSDLANSDEGCATLTPGGALTAGLAGGCFSAGPAALGIMQQPGGPRTNSMPCGGLQQLLMSGNDGMAGRVASWHYPGQMFAVAGGTQMMDPAAAAAMAARSASPFQQHAVQVTAVAAASIPGSLTSLLTDGSDTGAAAVAMGSSCGQQVIKEECTNPGAAAAAATTYQLHQQHQHWLHQQHYQQQHMMHHAHQQHMHMHHQQHHQQQQMAGVNPAQDLAAAAAMAAPGDMQAMQAGSGMQQMPHGAQQHVQDATTAGVVASAAMGLSLPGSPVLTSSLLQDMRSNDSAGLHSMLDQILNEADLADSTLALLGGGSDGVSSIAPQRSLAFDPPIISIPTPPDAPPCQAGNAPSPSPRPHAPPPTPVGGVAPFGPGVMGLLGQAGTCSSMHAAEGSREAAWGPSRLSNMSHAPVNAQGLEGNEGSLCPSSMQSPHPVSIKTEPFMQTDVQMQRVPSMPGPCPNQSTPQRQSSQQLPQQQQQQQMQQHQEQLQASAGLQGVPARPGSSTGTASQAAAMQAQSPEPGQGRDMTSVVAQLQEQNQLLMHRLHEMEMLQQRQEKMPGGNTAEVHAGVLAMVAGAEAAAAGAAAGPDTPAAAVRAVTPSSDHVMPAQGSSAAAAAAAASASFLSGFDHLMPQLRPVITRVGGSAGGLLGGSLGGMCPELAAVAESPAQLINTAFLDDHNLLDGL